MSVDFAGNAVQNEAEAKKVLDAIASAPHRIETFINDLPKIMGKYGLRYAVKSRHIDAMLTSAATQSRGLLKNAFMVTLAYPKFWGSLTNHVNTVGSFLESNRDVKTIAEIAHAFRGDTTLNRAIAPFVTKIARHIKTLPDAVTRNDLRDVLERAVRGSDVLEAALAKADQPESLRGPSDSVLGPNKPPPKARASARQP